MGGMPGKRRVTRFKPARSHLFDVASGDVLGRVGVAVDVAAGLVAEAALQLEGVVAGDGGEGERERVPQVVGP